MNRFRWLPGIPLFLFAETGKADLSSPDSSTDSGSATEDVPKTCQATRPFCCLLNRKSWIGLAVLLCAIAVEFMIDPHIKSSESAFWLVAYCLVNVAAAGAFFFIFLGMSECAWGSWSQTPRAYRLFAFLLPATVWASSSSRPVLLWAGRTDLLMASLPVFGTCYVLLLLLMVAGLVKEIRENRRRKRERRGNGNAESLS
ncbi:hypothetical protein AMJ85_05990 [candidate division BRC1 bacterium SM23_51]|nr:MAG: hypothetical protein AMJ85_05990 [candidate division BRC1 bacterium SM23_51]